MSNVTYVATTDSFKQAKDNKALRVFVRLAFDLDNDGTFNYIADDDILSCYMLNYKEVAGGYVTTGTIVLDNTEDIYNPMNDERLKHGLQVKVVYCIGNTETSLHRFTLYVDSKGFQLSLIGSKERTCTIELVDFSYYLKQTETKKDWTQTEKVTHCVIADKSQIKDSLVHIIAENADLTISDIDASFLPMSLDYVELSGSVWEELSLLAIAYKTHLECGVDAILTFGYSSYDDTFIQDQTELEILTSTDIFSITRFGKLANYKNTLRMKWTNYVFIDERVRLWTYTDEPVVYNSNNEASYHFVKNSRDIEKYAQYETPYCYVDNTGRNYTVVHAEDVFDKTEFENNIVVNGEQLNVLIYDTNTYKNKALVQLQATAPTILKKCEIWGKPIISHTNFSHFIESIQGVLEYGTHVLNVTNKYLSTSEYKGFPFYEIWAYDTLEDVSSIKSGYVIKTNKPLIHLRAGSCIGINLIDMCGVNEEKLKIESISFNYKKVEDFQLIITC